eukprot:gb/GEZN01007563.1/.p1 GENE.gb/GEZN01007563.1/~~gb/GEZN01007563.1/.p1  ORF type:complete len:355 (+),score=46.09 gb/GEZN01007563.1/:286-1350(+)
MGAVCGKQDFHGRQASAQIDAAFIKEKSDINELKLLLLGTGESGKSTILKQLIQVYGAGFNEDTKRLPYKPIVYTNAIVSMKTLIRESKRLYLDKKIELKLEDQSEDSCTLILDIKDFTFLNAERAHALKTLWADPAIQATYDRRNLFQLADECRWFFRRLDALAQENYIPSYDDMLRCRARSVGIVETCFTIMGNHFRLLDMGGQRSERKKWVHCFEHVTAVIFVAAINEYDQVLYEDGVTNRLHESLDLFQEICNSRWFKKSAIIVFLNKSDLFREKIAKVDMRCCFDEYEGGLDYDTATEFLQDEFKTRNEFQQIYLHITCATNLDNVTFTFNAVKDVIIKSGLGGMGLAL